MLSQPPVLQSCVLCTFSTEAESQARPVVYARLRKQGFRRHPDRRAQGSRSYGCSWPREARRLSVVECRKAALRSTAAPSNMLDDRVESVPWDTCAKHAGLPERLMIEILEGGGGDLRSRRHDANDWTTQDRGRVGGARRRGQRLGLAGSPWSYRYRSHLARSRVCGASAKRARRHDRHRPHAHDEACSEAGLRS